MYTRPDSAPDFRMKLVASTKIAAPAAEALLRHAMAAFAPSLPFDVGGRKTALELFMIT